jgi:hypothetical protein
MDVMMIKIHVLTLHEILIEHTNAVQNFLLDLLKHFVQMEIARL